MQTTIQFGSTSTFQEWRNFKGILSGAKATEEPLLKGGSNSENLVLHLSKQLQAGGMIKENVQTLPPAFPEKYFLNLVA